MLNFILFSSKFNAILHRYRLVSNALYYLFRCQYILDKENLTLKKIFGRYTLSDEIFIKFFEYYFFHQCCRYNFKNAYYLKYVVMKSISRRCIKTETICDTSLDVWMLLLESFEYQAFIGFNLAKPSHFYMTLPKRNL